MLKLEILAMFVPELSKFTWERLLKFTDKFTSIQPWVTYSWTWLLRQMASLGPMACIPQARKRKQIIHKFLSQFWKKFLSDYLHLVSVPICPHPLNLVVIICNPRLNETFRCFEGVNEIVMDDIEVIWILALTNSSHFSLPLSFFTHSLVCICSLGSVGGWLGG